MTTAGTNQAFFSSGYWQPKRGWAAKFMMVLEKYDDLSVWVSTVATTATTIQINTITAASNANTITVNTCYYNTNSNTNRNSIASNPISNGFFNGLRSGVYQGTK